MIIDYQFLSYGGGLVMAAFIAGMVVNAVFGVVDKVNKI